MRIFLFLLLSLSLLQQIRSSPDPKADPVPQRHSDVDVDAGDGQCSSRCRRLLSRSLSKIDYSVKKVDSLFRSNAPVKGLSDVCWKFYDYYDCEKQCEKRPKRSTKLEQLTKIVVKKCKFVDEDYSNNIKCIHRYHTFLEVRCSSYMNEAVKLRQLLDAVEDDADKKSKIQETCRFLHYHNMCLSNTVFFYCPNAKKLFNNFTLREYFLSFIVPENDENFSEQFLDYCQIFDFPKMAKAVYDTTSSVRIEDLNTDLRPTTLMPEVKLLKDDQLGTDGKSKERKVFASEEDLEETPPNFFYSSARYETTTFRPLPSSKEWSPPPPPKQQKTVYSSTNYWSPEPVTIEFMSHPVTSLPSKKSQNTSDSDAEASRGYTLDPNQILSTIFKFPSIFPTTVTAPDPVTGTIDGRRGDTVALDPSKADDEDNDYYSDSDELKNDLNGESGDEEESSTTVVWRSRPLLPAATVRGAEKEQKKFHQYEVDKDAELEETTTWMEVNDDATQKVTAGPGVEISNEILKSNEGSGHVVVAVERIESEEGSEVGITPGSEQEAEIERVVETTTPDGHLRPLSREELQRLSSKEIKIVHILSGQNSSEKAAVSAAPPPQSTTLTNSSEILTPLGEGQRGPGHQVYPEVREPEVINPRLKGPLLSGIKVHIKRIRHYSELDKDRDRGDETRLPESVDDDSSDPDSGDSSDFFDNNNDDIRANRYEPNMRNKMENPVDSPKTASVDSRKQDRDKGEGDGEGSEFWESVINTEEEGDPPTFLEGFHDEIANVSAVKWFLLLYTIIFVVAFFILLYLIVSIIAKKCRKSGKYVIQEE